MAEYKIPPYIFNMHSSDINKGTTDIDDIMRKNLIYNRKDLNWYEKFNRYGAIDPFNKLTRSREYMFFTKPDCHIVNPGTMNLQPVLKDDTFFNDLLNRYPHVIQQLQSSAGSYSLNGGSNNIDKNPFMVLLSNSVKNTIDFSSLSAAEMDGPVNMYGSSISYRKDAWTGEENIDFSLEFEDTRYLEVYMLLKAYEEYERYKTLGMIYPPNPDGSAQIEAKPVFNDYMKNKELHDTFGIYRIIVGDDGETIVYWAYICGAYFNSVPRDAFNDVKNGEGLTFSAEFKAFCAIDMDPIILANLNRLVDASSIAKNRVIPVYGSSGYKTYRSEAASGEAFWRNESSETPNTEWASIPYIVKVDQNSYNPEDVNSYWNDVSQGMKFRYRLIWYGEA